MAVLLGMSEACVIRILWYSEENIIYGLNCDSDGGIVSLILTNQ